MIPLLSLLFLIAPVYAQDEKPRKDFRIDLNFYPYLEDLKTDTDVTVNLNARLPYRFSYFSFINFGGVSHDGKARFLLTEQNLRWRITEKLPVDFALQFKTRGGSDNDEWWLGFRWRLNDTPGLGALFDRIHLLYGITFNYKNFNQQGDDKSQMEHTFKMTFPWLSERLYLRGFIDHTFGQDIPANIPTPTIISEIQMGVRLFDHVYAITEYRINENRRSDVNNLAIGVEYQAGW